MLKYITPILSLGFICVHGVLEEYFDKCTCKPGYSGPQCETGKIFVNVLFFLIFFCPLSFCLQCFIVLNCFKELSSLLYYKLLFKVINLNQV